jgi:hypothetical protein
LDGEPGHADISGIPGLPEQEIAMTTSRIHASTGIHDLDRVLCGLAPGDNVVWQVETMADYATFVRPFAEAAVRQGAPLTYFRFARHEALLEEQPGVTVLALNTHLGFETFLDAIHQRIETQGRGACYVFDCMSDLAADWFSDQMVGNFFMLTCPFLRRLHTVAYFALLRDFHSGYATAPVRDTAQVMLDVYAHDGGVYVHPVKVSERSSPEMYHLHVYRDGEVRRVTESHTIAEVLTHGRRSTVGLARRHLGVWSRTFVQAESLLEASCQCQTTPEEVESMRLRLLRMAMSRQERILGLISRYFTLGDLVHAGTRMLGTGLIGGKAVEMLLARAILRQADPRWEGILETHDSYFIPSDVFYTYLVTNGCWMNRKRPRTIEEYFEEAENARHGILEGSFPPHIERRFADMLDYFGQSPVVVRSSSLLEDSFGNAFAGKYESVYCASQGSREARLEDFIAAVKTVYASTLSREALAYRARHGLLDSDEQMALLVQRVSGAQHDHLYFPHVAGVAFSFNPYVWSEHIDPHAGMMRLVFGLGTRAVDRTDDDYTRLVALNAPHLRPEEHVSDLPKPAQHKVDVLDLEHKKVVSLEFEELLRRCPELPWPLFTSHDRNLARLRRRHGGRGGQILTFDQVLTNTAFVEDVRAMLRTLEAAYRYPVDVEFAADFQPDGNYRLSLLQCRPFQAKHPGESPEPPADPQESQIVFKSSGPVIGRSRAAKVDRFIYVVPEKYGQLPIKERYAVARLIGRLNQADAAPDRKPFTVLLGPGRWGSSTPSLGVPVSFSEICHASVLCEIVAMREDLVPDVSLGTHFFNELVELDILYLALTPTKMEDRIQAGFFENAPNLLETLAPNAGLLGDIVRVIEPEASGDAPVHFWADTTRQRVLCYQDPA